MITINLLPQEFRRRDRTSPKVLAAVMGGVLLVTSSAGYLGYRWFGVLAEKEQEKTRLEENLRNLEQSAAYQEALVKEAAEYQKRSDTIQQISESRVLWTRKVDQLIDIVNNDGDTERHTVWFKNLTIRPGDGKAAGPALSLRAYSQTDQFAKVANFLDDVKRHDFFKDFRTISAPGGRVAVDPKKFPQETVEFPFDLSMKGPKEWERNREAAARRPKDVAKDQKDGKTAGQAEPAAPAK